MGPYLEMFSGVFVDVRAANHAEAAYVGRQRYRPRDSGTGPFGRFHDLTGGKIQHLVVERLENNPDFLPSYHTFL